jgi:protein required for attachment to host cells
MGVFWVIVADRSDAKIFKATSPRAGFRRVTEIEHPISKLKIHSLVSDRPGRVCGTAGAANVRHNLVGEEDPLEHLAKVFAKDISETIQREFSKGEFDEFVLVAEPGFMGRMMAALPKKLCHKHLAATVTKELTQLVDSEIETRLRSVMTYLWGDPSR